MKNNIEQTLEERGSKYGEFKDFAEISQSLKDIVFLNINLDTEKEEINNVIVEGIDMICHKLARIANGNPYYLDSWRDLSAYAKLVCDELEKTDGTTDVKTKQVIRKNNKWVHEVDLEQVDENIENKKQKKSENEEDELLSKEEIIKLNHENFTKAWDYVIEKTFNEESKDNKEPKNWKAKCGDCKYCNHIVEQSEEIDFYVCNNPNNQEKTNIIHNGNRIKKYKECKDIWKDCKYKESVFK